MYPHTPVCCCCLMNSPSKSNFVCLIVLSLSRAAFCSVSSVCSHIRIMVKCLYSFVRLLSLHNFCFQRTSHTCVLFFWLLPHIQILNYVERRMLDNWSKRKEEKNTFFFFRENKRLHLQGASIDRFAVNCLQFLLISVVIFIPSLFSLVVVYL